MMSRRRDQRFKFLKNSTQPSYIQNTPGSGRMSCFCESFHLSKHTMNTLMFKNHCSFKPCYAEYSKNDIQCSDVALLQSILLFLKTSRQIICSGKPPETKKHMVRGCKFYYL
jgi:hypothetical protein